jgi:intein/homing endonuclease
LNSLDFIKKLDNEQKIVFLRALFDDEGCVSIKKYQIIIEMANKTLIENIKSLLLDMGIRSGKISKVVEIDYKNRYRISISGKGNLELFYRKINFINRDKRNKLYILLNSYKIK